MKNIFSLTALVISVAFLSCTKHQGDVEEHIPTAILSFSNPTEGAVYHNGDSVSIEGKGVSTESAHGYDISIRKANDTTVYYFQHIHDHNDTLIINQKWKNSLTEPA